MKQYNFFDCNNMDCNSTNSISCSGRNNIDCSSCGGSSDRSHHNHHHHPQQQQSHPSSEERPSSSWQNETQPLLAPISSTSNRATITNYYFLLQSTSGVGQEGENMLKLANDKKSKNGIEERSEIDGYHAFLTLAFIFIINANTLASLKVYGIIFEKIVADKYYTREEAAWPVSTASTVQNLAGLLTPILAMRISWRSIELIQASLFIIANVGAYLSNNLTLDIICLGIIQGVAFSIRYNMNVVINNEYFQKYRATAMGISMAGSSCGVFFLKPYVAYVLDSSGAHQFRDAYLALAMIMSFNLILSLFIRKPKNSAATNEFITNNNTTNNEIVNALGEDESLEESETAQENGGLSRLIVSLLKNPSIHCIWIMQTIYFYISRTYTIFIVDYGLDQGFSRDSSRNLLTSWVLGEVGGRFLLGAFVDYKLLNLKWNIIIVNILLAGSGFALLVEPSVFFENNNLVENSNNQSFAESFMMSNTTTTTIQQQTPTDNSLYFWYMSIVIAMVAALSSLLNIMIVPFSQEYLGKKNVPWAFALGSIVTSVFLLLRPVLIGLSKDSRNSYGLLIIIMSSVPCIYGVLFLIMEPFLKRHRYRRVSIDPIRS